MQPNYPTATSTWGEEETQAVMDVLQSGRFTMGEKTEEFEQRFAEYIGTKYCIAVNSGSSANLLMVAAYTLRHGAGTVIVPSIGWSTSYSPFEQYRWKLKFVDIDKETLNYDIKSLQKAYTGREVILAINLLGNPNDFEGFPHTDILEDNCESMGAMYFGRKTGSFGLMGSHSTYFAHHICTMEGGMVTTDDEYFYQMLLSLRSHGWTRHLPKNNLLGAKVDKFTFIYPGFNVRPTEMQSAIGLAQLKKLPKFVEHRQENKSQFVLYCKKRGWGYQKSPFGGHSSSFGCALFTPDIQSVKDHFDAKGIEYRPIMSGNFTKSPSIKYYDYEISGTLENTDYVESTGIFVGNHHYPVDWSFLD